MDSLDSGEAPGVIIFSIGISDFSIRLDLASVGSKKGPNEPVSLSTVETSSKFSKVVSHSVVPHAKQVRAAV